MKKIIPFFFVAFCLFKTVAQPQLTNTILPVPGDTVLLSVDTLLRPSGVAGAGVSWDFTQIKSNFTTKRIYKQASATPYSSTFPSATMARTDVNGYFFSYWKNSGNTSVYYGFVQPGVIDQNYNTMPVNYYKFPVKYNDAYTENFSATTNPGNITGAGKYSFIADAWGVLKLPKIIVTNALRTKSVMYIGDSSINSYSLTTEYAWYVNGQKDPILLISSVVVNKKLTQKVTLFYNSPLLNISAIDFNKSALKMYPNPAQSILNLRCDDFHPDEKVQIKIYDALGRIQYQSEVNTASSQYQLDISAYPAGCYIVEISAEDRTLHQKFTKE